jgi:hypothetical protein
MSTRVVELAAPVTPAAVLAVVRQAEPGERLIFVLPPATDALAAVVPLQILRRQADAARVQVALVTTDPDIRYHARQARLPVFPDVQRAQGRWRYPSPLPPLPSPRAVRPPVILPPRGRVGLGLQAPAIVTVGDTTLLDGTLRRRAPAVWAPLFGYLLLSLLLVATLAALAVLLVPQATVTLVPAHTRLVSSLEITARTGIDQPDYVNRLVPARVVQARVEGTGTTMATGSMFAPADKARGVVTFINRTAREIVVPANTVVRTITGNNVRFRTESEVTVPAGVGQRTNVAVEALEPGRQGNVAAFAIGEIEGPLGLSLRVTNEAPTSGGTMADVVVVTQADKERLLGELQQQLQAQAYARLGESLRQGEYIPPETVQTFTLAETYDRFAGEQSPTLSLQLQLLARGMAVDLAGAQTLAARALRESVPQGHFLLEDTIQYGAVQFIRFDQEAVQMTLTAAGEALLPIRTGEVRALLAGTPLNEATRLLQRRFELARPPEITLEPDWTGRLPYIPTRIKVLVLQR